MRAPAFWWQTPGLCSTVLAPIGAIYGAVAGSRMRQTGARADVPVICIGDPTVGGAGKTPVAIAVAKTLIAQGKRPYFLTRGYGGREQGPLLLDPAKHSAADAGDEPLLLAAVAPVVVSADRVAGAKLAAQSGADVIVMDDGFQNPALIKNLSLLVIDAKGGVGNGRVFPAGPLRAPLAEQLQRANAIVLIGNGEAGEQVARDASKVLRASIVPDADAAAALKGKSLFAYAGIGRPEKFFATLESIGGNITERRAFPDHHAFSADEANELLAAARSRNLTLVTTEKDLARMRGNAGLNELADASKALPITLRFQDERALDALLTSV
ncbi:MAG TPA: tetraacyldisaccharide 4'-kinase [Xanthobacteraceae bacterium]|jgi:tetraacyldisaccharide 4'-kinase|nr:tetraacyldisaccharide 4'-kinase [Xanthobacteraceae bacterium]